MAKPAPITIPTEAIGSIPKPLDHIEGVAKGDGEDPKLAPLYEDTIRDTIERFEATGSPVVTNGAYCLHGLPKMGSQLQSTHFIETPEEVHDCSCEPGKNWRRCQGDG